MKSKFLLLPAVCVLMSGCGVDWFPAVSSTSSSSSNTDNSNLPAPTVRATLNPTSITSGGSSTLTLTIFNKVGNPAQTGMGFVEAIPAGATATIANNSQCGGSFSVLNNQLIFSTGQLASGTVSCTLTANLTATGSSNIVVKSADFTSLVGGLVNGVTDQTLTVLAPVATPTLTATLNPTSITSGGNSTLTLTLQNDTSNAARTGLAFTETIPTGVTATVANASQCGGTLAVSGQTLSFTGGSLAAGTSTCALTANLTATGSTAQSFTVKSADFSGLQGLTSGVADQTLTVTPVVTTPTLTAALTPAALVDGTNTELIFTITNAASKPAQSGLAFVESLPAGLAATVATASQCGGTVSVTGSGSQISFTGGTLASGATNCTITTQLGLGASLLKSINTDTPFTLPSTGFSGLQGGLVNGVTDQTLKVFPAAVTSATGGVTVSNLAPVGVADLTLPQVNFTFSADTANPNASVSATVELAAVDSTGTTIASTDKSFSFTVPTGLLSSQVLINTTPLAVSNADFNTLAFWRLLKVTVP